MRIATTIFLIIAGIASIAYSYVGSLLTLAGDVEGLADQGNDVGAVSLVFDFILRGEVPQLTGFMYFGLLLFVIAIVNLIRTKSKHDR